MNRTTPIVLLSLLVVAGIYVVIFEIREETRFWTDVELKERESRVFDVERGDAVTKSIREIAITREGETVTFKRRDKDTWSMTEPVASPARKGLIDGLVGGLLFMKKVGDDIPEGEFPPKGLAAFGLEKPRIVVTMKTAEGPQAAQYSLNIGGEDPTRQYVYAQRPFDAGVMLLEKGSIELLSRGVNDYRETRFVRFDRNKVTSLDLRWAAATVELEKDAGTWTVMKPYHDRADSLRLEDVLRAVGDIEAQSFAVEEAGNLQPFGLDRPRIQIAFTRDDNTTDTVLIGAEAAEPVGTVYAKLADQTTIYTTKDEVVDKLTFRAEYLRDRNLARFASTAVQEFRLEGAGPGLVLRKSDGAWKIVEPVQMDAQEDAVDSFLRAVAGLDILRFPKDAPDAAALARCGLDEKSRITLTLKLEGEPEQQYAFGGIDPEQKDLYVMRKDSESVYTVRETFREGVTSTYLDFRKRRIAEMSRYDMQKVTIRRPAGTITLARGADDKWRMTAPVSAPADEINVGHLLDDLNDPEAVRFLAEKAEKPAEYGLDKPAYEVIVELKPGKDKPTQTKTLLVGKEMGADGYAAKLAAEEVVFTVSNTLVERLGQEFRKRLVWQVRRTDVSRLVWTKGAEKVSARLENGTWKLIEPAGRKADATSLDYMLDAVGFLRVERFEAYTRDQLSKYGLDKPSVTLTLTVQDADRTLSIGADRDKDSVYVMVSNDDAVFALPKTTVKPLLSAPLAPPEKSGTN